MYSIDINFLRDRGLDELSKKLTQTKKANKPIKAQVPIMIGGAIALALPAATFGYLKVVETQKAQLEQDIQKIDGEIANANAKNQQIQQIRDQITAIDTDINSLVSVFNQIKPWSAILTEVESRIPPGVQIDSIQQQDSTANPAIAELAITGIARSYNDVNDFLLFLQRSSFINGQKTKIETAELIDLPIQIKNRQELKENPDPENLPTGLKNINNVADENVAVNFPKGVKYVIKTELNDVPASQLLGELTNKGSVGLVTRIKTLDRKGAITK